MSDYKGPKNPPTLVEMLQNAQRNKITLIWGNSLNPHSDVHVTELSPEMEDRIQRIDEFTLAIRKAFKDGTDK